jgi:hypothetical protein
VDQLKIQLRKRNLNNGKKIENLAKTGRIFLIYHMIPTGPIEYDLLFYILQIYYYFFIIKL